MKKNGKTLMIFVLIIFFMLLTWFVDGGTYSTGAYVSNGINPSGIFDFFVFLYYSLTYKAMDIIYILTIGGAYGVLSNISAYRKLVDKTAKFIKNNDILSLCIATFLIALYTSIAGDIIVILGIAPFIVTSFLKAKKDRLTALSAGFGGLFIGLIGKTVGTFGVASLISGLEISASSLIGYKIILFVVAYALYNLFAVMHMRKVGSVDLGSLNWSRTEDNGVYRFSAQISNGATSFPYNFLANISNGTAAPPGLSRMSITRASYFSESFAK